MEALNILKKVGIRPDKPVLLISSKDAIENLMVAIKEYCSHLDLNNMEKEDIEVLLDSYGECIKKYHPENFHQERAALLMNFEMLKRFGLTDDDYNAIDFY